MRETYVPASSETISILGSNRQGIADEAAFTPNTIDQILAGNAGDPFLHFYRYYAACVRAGVDVTAWDAKLSSVKTKAVGDVSETKCISEVTGKFSAVVQRWLLALEDDVIEPHEVEPIRRAITRARTALDVAEAKLPCDERKARVASVVRGKFQTNGRD